MYRFKLKLQARNADKQCESTWIVCMCFEIDQMLDHCWPFVYDIDPVLNQTTLMSRVWKSSDVTDPHIVNVIGQDDHLVQWCA